MGRKQRNQRAFQQQQSMTMRPASKDGFCLRNHISSRTQNIKLAARVAADVHEHDGMNACTSCMCVVVAFPPRKERSRWGRTVYSSLTPTEASKARSAMSPSRSALATSSCSTRDLSSLLAAAILDRARLYWKISNEPDFWNDGWTYPLVSAEQVVPPSETGRVAVLSCQLLQ